MFSLYITFLRYKRKTYSVLWHLEVGGLWAVVAGWEWGVRPERELMGPRVEGSGVVERSDEGLELCDPMMT